jgi:hypothetical protein
VIPMYLGAVFLFVCAFGCLRRGIGVWRKPHQHVSLQFDATGLDASILILGVAVLCTAFLALGDAISVHGTRSGVGFMMFAIAGVAYLPLTFLFVSVQFFSRPRFLIPPHLRPTSGKRARSLRM